MGSLCFCLLTLDPCMCVYFFDVTIACWLSQNFKWRCVVIYSMRSCVCRLYFPTVLFSFAHTHWFEDINFYLYIVRICFRPLLILSISFVRYESVPCIAYGSFLAIEFSMQTSDEHFLVTCVESFLSWIHFGVSSVLLKNFVHGHVFALYLKQTAPHSTHKSFSWVLFLRWNQLIINAALQTEKVNKLRG